MSRATGMKADVMATIQAAFLEGLATHGTDTRAHARPAHSLAGDERVSAMKRKRSSWLPLFASTRDVGLVLFGECQSQMGDDDPHEHVCAAVQLLTILEGEGVSVEEQRERLHRHFDEGVAALQLYRQRKGDLRPLLALLRSDLSDGAKVAGTLMLLCGLETAPDIAAATGRSVRSVERHCAEVRRSRETHAVLRTPAADHTQTCVPMEAA